MATPFYQSSKGEWVEHLALMLDELWPEGYAIEWNESWPDTAEVLRAGSSDRMEVYRGPRAIDEALDRKLDMLPEWDDYDQWADAIEHVAAEDLPYNSELLAQLAAELSENEGEPGAYTEGDMEGVIGGDPVEWYTEWLGGSEANYNAALDLFGVTENKVRAYLLGVGNYPHVQGPRGRKGKREDFINTLWQGEATYAHFGRPEDPDNNVMVYIIYDR
jgi:hypothetical protein